MSTATLTAVSLTAAPASRGAAARPARPARPVRPVHPGGRAVPAPSPLVLTRRGRRLVRAGLLGVVTVLLAAGLVLAWVGLAATVAPGASAGDGSAAVVSGAGMGAATETVEVVVRPGDTLWALARAHAPERDPRSVVGEIVRLNDLGSAGVQAGAVLLVPAG